MGTNRNKSSTTWQTWQFLATGLLSLSIQQCMSHVTYIFFTFFFSFLTKCWSKSVEGLLSTGPTPSSFIRYQQFQLLYLSVCIGRRKGLVHSLLGEVIDYPNQTLDYRLATHRQSHLQSHILVPQKTHVVQSQ